MKLPKIKCEIIIKNKITFWQAIKLRIAGKNYLGMIEKIGKEIELKLKEKKFENT